MRRWGKRLVYWLGLPLMALLALHLVTRAPGYHWLDLPSEYRGSISVHVVDHGYHSGVILSRVSLLRAARELDSDDPTAAARLRWLADLYPEAVWLEIGWGDAAFYQQTPRIGDVDVLLGLGAILWPTDAVLQVVPGWGVIETGFPESDIIRLKVTLEELTGLAERLAETIPEPVPNVAAGPSLYGQGAFYQAELDYHLFRTCNHWVAWLLRGAGVPASPVPGTFSTTLMAELRWRLDYGN